ncbi:MAG: hypothetical protein HC835_06200 [Oscillatoriales cyanobacterium RM2_1_1]|nr:hypothetical protein [Oscillatoriales cyanobacterium SM2_3_0]NJO45245.1 hypothetical protein [Oscillatoriales cyanobacterium RM2_1_1]
MTPAEINTWLRYQFEASVTQADPTSWQVENENFRLLVLLSEDESWVRMLIPIAPVQQAQDLLGQLLEANFDRTLEIRYAIHQEIIWGVFQHSLISLVSTDFISAISGLIALHQQGVSELYNNLIEQRILQVIQVAKRQGQSIEETMQTLERFYAEGLMGEMSDDTATRDQTLGAWRSQLERMWPQVELE